MQAEISGGNKAATCITRQENQQHERSPTKAGKHIFTQRCHQHTCWALEGLHYIKSIADFLVPEEGVLLREIEEEDCIKFFDGPDEI